MGSAIKVDTFTFFCAFLIPGYLCPFSEKNAYIAKLYVRQFNEIIAQL